MPRAQAARPFMYAIATIFLILILSFSFVYIKDIAKTAREREVITFIKSVQGIIDTQSKQSFGSHVDRSIAVPEGVNSVCFVDQSQKTDRFVNNELTVFLEHYPESNFFILPLEDFMAEKLENFEVPKSPLCIRVINGKINLRLLSQFGTTLVGTPARKDEIEECTSIFYTSEPNQGIDIVFLGQAYGTTEEFKNDVYDYINDVFFKLEPFHSHRDNFNFYIVDDFQDLGCTFEGYVLCNSFKVKRLASRCPHEFIFILIDRNKIKDFIMPIRSSAIANIANINTADKPSVLMHEFGHSFADLADEYVDDYYLAIKFDGERYPNCDNSRCSKWSGIEGTDCLKGCSTDGYYRGTKNSLMKSLSAEYYGPINEKAITENLDVYKR
ncbi:M64 family metallopeptidase [Candidatus Woesearchaeota archaeon]|nr:M64 family metallopeptidase [Candidatus Woesearchaeota archaeon]